MPTLMAWAAGCPKRVSTGDFLATCTLLLIQNICTKTKRTCRTSPFCFGGDSWDRTDPRSARGTSCPPLPMVADEWYVIGYLQLAHWFSPKISHQSKKALQRCQSHSKSKLGYSLYLSSWMILLCGFARCNQHNSQRSTFRG